MCDVCRRHWQSVCVWRQCFTRQVCWRVVTSRRSIRRGTFWQSRCGWSLPCSWWYVDFSTWTAAVVGLPIKLCSRNSWLQVSFLSMCCCTYVHCIYCDTLSSWCCWLTVGWLVSSWSCVHCGEMALTSTWPHLRCDVGLEEGEYRENCLCVAVLCTIVMVH